MNKTNATIYFAKLPEIMDPKNFEYSVDLFLAEIKLGILRHDSTHVTRRYEYPFILRNILPAAWLKILDAGGGESVLGPYLAQWNTVVNLDNTSYVAPLMNRLTGRLPNYSAVEGDIRQIPYPDNYFDFTICVSVLEHLPKDQIRLALNELLRVTSGKLLITMDILESQFSVNDLRTLIYPMQIENTPQTLFTLKNGAQEEIFTIAYLIYEGIK